MGLLLRVRIFTGRRAAPATLFVIFDPKPRRSGAPSQAGIERRSLGRNGKNPLWLSKNRKIRYTLIQSPNRLSACGLSAGEDEVEGTSQEGKDFFY
jgi:hypothetical protein